MHALKLSALLAPFAPLALFVFAGCERETVVHEPARPTSAVVMAQPPAQTTTTTVVQPAAPPPPAATTVTVSH